MQNLSTDLAAHLTQEVTTLSTCWKIVRTDGTVHQFPFFPGRNPVRWEGLESNRTVRRLLSPFAYTYLVSAEKSATPR